MPLLRVFVVGGIGNGKSSICNAIAKHLGYTGTFFSESDGIDSHTDEVVSLIIGNTEVNDTPGILHPDGFEKDEVTIHKIVDEAKHKQYINAIFLVLNEANYRFDDSMQTVVKIIVDSFGLALLNHLAIIFSNSLGNISASEAEIKALAITALISTKLNTNVPTIPHHQIECHPEKLQQIFPSLPQEGIDALKAKNALSITNLLQWAKNKMPLDTQFAVYGQYEEQKRIRDANYAISVVREVSEKQIRDISTVKVPLYRTVPVMHTTYRRFGPFRHHHDEWVNENQHYATKTTIKKCEEQRVVQTLGNGTKIFGNWKHVRDFEIVTQ